ncbi:MAG: Sec-independent protein translocase protein TatB [Oligoflexia bacterium]|nr:Sec-independent protein translocase protein TatB [Oligoflexia bacterium]
MFNLGFSEMLLLAAIALIFIGPKQLPQLAKVLGRTIGELKKAMSDVTVSMTSNVVDDEIKNKKTSNELTKTDDKNKSST